MTRAGTAKTAVTSKTKKHKQHKGKGGTAHGKRHADRAAPGEAAPTRVQGAEAGEAPVKHTAVRFHDDEEELIDDLDLGGESEGEQEVEDPDGGTASPHPAVNESDSSLSKTKVGSMGGGVASAAALRGGFTDSARGLQARAAAKSSTKAFNSSRASQGAPAPLNVTSSEAHEGSALRTGSWFSWRSSVGSATSRSSGRLGKGRPAGEGRQGEELAEEASGEQAACDEEQQEADGVRAEASGESAEASDDDDEELHELDVYQDYGSSEGSVDEHLTIEVPDSDDPLALMRLNRDAPNRRKHAGDTEKGELFLGDNENVPKVESYFQWVPTHVEHCTGFDVRTHFGFYSLFSNGGPHKLMVNMPDMVLVAGGIPVYWMFTSQQGQHKGSILRKLAEKSEPSIIRCSFLRSAHADERNFEHHVAFLHQDASSTAVIGEKAFSRMIDALDNERNIGQRIVQKYVKPLKDIGYRTTMTKKGDLMDFSTVTFRMSHAYRPLQSQTGVVFPTRKMSAVGSRRRAEPEEVLPAPEGAIANECHKVVQSIMRYMARAWQLDLDELVCEFIRSKDFKLVLLRVQTFEWREGQLVE